MRPAAGLVPAGSLCSSLLEDDEELSGLTHLLLFTGVGEAELSELLSASDDSDTAKR